MKVKAYFSRKEPFHLMAKEEMSDSASFDAYPVEVDDDVLHTAQQLRRLLKDMDDQFLENPAPEDCAAEEALVFAAELQRICKRTLA